MAILQVRKLRLTKVACPGLQGKWVAERVLELKSDLPTPVDLLCLAASFAEGGGRCRHGKAEGQGEVVGRTPRGSLLPRPQG